MKGKFRLYWRRGEKMPTTDCPTLKKGGEVEHLKFLVKTYQEKLLFTSNSIISKIVFSPTTTIPLMLYDTTTSTRGVSAKPIAKMKLECTT